VTTACVPGFAARIQQTDLAPARDRHLLDDVDRQATRPAAADRHAVDPGDVAHGAGNGLQVDRNQTLSAAHASHGLLDVERRHALEPPRHGNRLDRLVECDTDQPARGQHTGNAHGSARPALPVELRQRELPAPSLGTAAAVALVAGADA